MVSRLLKPLKSAGVIGDVVDVFTPSVKMSVVYNTNMEVHNGFEFMPSSITSSPQVQLLDTDPATFFTLIMTDPDSPSPSDPSGREYLHWIVSDIPGTKSNSFGREIVSYENPRAIIGIHRYVFVLFKQNGRGTVDPPQSRQHFKTRQFAERNGLGSPVAVVYFNARKETAARFR
ncbi:CEN-like protein 1 [Cryptomeria japonica]|uniref:CEN-like protein 1 n=1 Tax=Cryptomeria japonica TaxID=3369 RepID=UPI0025ACEB4A|nr:CEN-like protein 1 [Cryptomeria japonica]